MNVDGSFQAESGAGGVGVVVRDERGRCVVAFAKPFPHAHSAFHMEAEAVREGLVLAATLSWDGLIVESDCSLLVTALLGDVSDRSDVSRVMDDCKLRIAALGSIQVCHINREANGVAHRLATLASNSSSTSIWYEEAPAIIQDVLFEDSCMVTRGLGAMSPSM